MNNFPVKKGQLWRPRYGDTCLRIRIYDVQMTQTIQTSKINTLGSPHYIYVGSAPETIITVLFKWEIEGVTPDSYTVQSINLEGLLQDYERVTC